MKFVTSQPARLYAVVAASVALVAHYVPSLPVVLVLALAAAVLGVGEAVQRVEDGKTAEALATPAPSEGDQAEGVDQLAFPFEVDGE
ncbi:hypothetical protein [Kitasatospora purpeofusca]|uniref:hypothetical protein n=1 Tax=Kitasatospora purpeofusca TaxID=67352 RepID=UPI00386EE874